jgi:hypothetical protein
MDTYPYSRTVLWLPELEVEIQPDHLRVSIGYGLLLDRGYGRPIQAVELSEKTVSLTKVQVVFVKPGERMTAAPCQNTVPLKSLT